MAKEILLYTGIYSYTAENIINALDAYDKKPIRMRVNSPGGNAMAAWGLYDKVKEHGDVTIQVDGMAMSAAGNLLFYAKKVVALDVSTILFHRAATSGDDDLSKQWLDKVNADLKARMLVKINDAKFKAITGFSIEEMFSMDDRKNILMTAQQAKDIGLVDEIKQLTPEIRTEIESFGQFQTEWNIKIAADGTSSQNPNTMTVEELKTKFPAVYASIFESGKAEGVTAGVTKGQKEERDRVNAWSQFATIDAEAVKKGIESGEPVTMATISAMTVKGMSKEHLEKVKTDSAAATVETGATVPPKTEKEKEIADFESKVNKGLEEVGLLKPAEAKK